MHHQQEQSFYLTHPCTASLVVSLSSLIATSIGELITHHYIAGEGLAVAVGGAIVGAVFGVLNQYLCSWMNCSCGARMLLQINATIAGVLLAPGIGLTLLQMNHDLPATLIDTLIGGAFMLAAMMFSSVMALTGIAFLIASEELNMESSIEQAAAILP